MGGSVEHSTRTLSLFQCIFILPGPGYLGHWAKGAFQNDFWQGDFAIQNFHPPSCCQIFQPRTTRPRKCPGRSYPHSSTSVAKATKSKGKNLKVVPLHLYMTMANIWRYICIYIFIVHLCIYNYTPYVSICVAWYHSLPSLNATVGSNKNDTFEFSFVPVSHHHRQSFSTKRPPIH